MVARLLYVTEEQQQNNSPSQLLQVCKVFVTYLTEKSKFAQNTLLPTSYTPIYSAYIQRLYLNVMSYTKTQKLH